MFFGCHSFFGTARLIGVPRQTNLLVLDTAKISVRVPMLNQGLHRLAVPCPKKWHQYQNFSRALPKTL